MILLAAMAGKDVTVSLPQTWATLDGSGSSDDVKLTSFKWKKLSGPSAVTFVPADNAITNATGLTKGQYQFQLTVIDSDANIAVDSITVTVIQSTFIRL